MSKPKDTKLHNPKPNGDVASRTLQVRVTPKAAANRITWQENGAAPRLRVYVTAVPESGKANAAMIALLAKELGVAKTSVVIIRGESTRDKIIRIDGEKN